MKKVLSLVLALSFILTCFVGCSKRPSAEKVVSNALDAVRSCNKEKIDLYFADNELVLNEDAEDTEEVEDSEKYQEAMKLIFKGLTYEIVSSEESDTTAKVVTKITNVSLTPIMSELYGEILTLAFAEAFSDESSMSDEDYTDLIFNKLVEKLQKEGNITKTTEVTITLSLKDDEWKIDKNEDLVTAILGGYSGFDDSASTGDETLDKLVEVDNWATDIWNDICDMSWYYGYGTDACGETMDPEFTIKQMNKKLKDKAGHDEFMANLGDDYADVVDIWNNLSPQIDSACKYINDNGASGGDFDTGLLQQYNTAFSEAVYEMQEY